MVIHNNSASQPISKKTPVVVILSILAFCLTVLIVIWLNLSWRPDVTSLPPDSGFYAYVGKAILHGQVLYRDVWDDKPPLGYYLNALGQLVFGQTPWGVWWSSVIWILGCTLLLLLLIKKLFGGITAVIASAIFIVALMNPQIFQGGNLMEVFGLAPQIGVIGASYLFFTKNRQLRFAVLAGGLTAGAFLIKQPTIVLGCVSILIMTICSISEHKFSQAFKTLLGFFLGVFGLIALVSIYWIWIGAGDKLLDGAILQGISFIGDSESHLKENFFYTLINILPDLMIGSLYLIGLVSAGFFLLEKLYRIWLKPILTTRLLVLDWCVLAVSALIPLAGNLLWPNSYFGKFWVISIFAIGFYILIRFYRLQPKPVYRQVFSPLEWIWLIAVISLPFEVVMVSLVGGNSGHYFITMLPSMVIAVAYPIHRVAFSISQAIRNKTGWFRNIAYMVLMLTSLIWGLVSFTQDLPASVYRSDITGIFKNQNYLSQVEQYIIQTTHPDDKVLVWHIHLGINFVTDRQAPSRFLFPLNLFIPPRKENLKLTEYINDLENHPPVLILVQKPSSLSLPFVDDPLDSLCKIYCNPEFEQALKVPEIQHEWLRLQEFFNAHYALDKRIYDWTLYRKLP